MNNVFDHFLQFGAKIADFLDYIFMYPETSFLTMMLWFALRDEVCPLGRMFTSLFTQGVNTLLFRRMEGRTENFTPRG
jgi:hypothetical protein